MRLIYICDQCNSYIDEIEVSDFDESMLGFNALTMEEREELLKLDWDRQVGTVMAICDNCLAGLSRKEDDFSQKLPGLH